MEAALFVLFEAPLNKKIAEFNILCGPIKTFKQRSRFNLTAKKNCGSPYDLLVIRGKFIPHQPKFLSVDVNISKNAIKSMVS